MAIRFFSDGVPFHLKDQRKISQWIKQVATKEGKKTGNLCYVFVSDEIILEFNKKYLQHNDYTDIITFDNSAGNTISGDMYISIDTVRINANNYRVDFLDELFRVMVHGALHLCGHKDKTIGERQEMRIAEDKYLSELTLSR